jgi:hypothetical protein
MEISTKISGLIDSASISGVAVALSYDKIDEWTSWMQTTATEVTSLLCSNDSFHIAPGLKSLNYDGLYETIMRPLKDNKIIYEEKISDQSIAAAENISNSWLSANLDFAKNKFFNEIEKSYDYQQWLEKNVKYFLVPHQKMYGSIFNQQYIPYLSSMFNISESEINDIWQRSTDVNNVNDWVKQKDKTQLADLAIKFYSVSALFRGLYHDNIAKLTRNQIVHHPLRRNYILEKGDKKFEFKASNTEVFITSFVLANAFIEDKLENRINNWTEKVLRVRKLVNGRLIDLSRKNSDDIARDYVISVLKQHRLADYSKKFKIAFDTVSDLLLAGGFFCLTSWTGIDLKGVAEVAAETLFGAGVIEGVKKVTKISDLEEKTLSTFANNKFRLAKLVDTIPGRIETKLV